MGTSMDQLKNILSSLHERCRGPRGYPIMIMVILTLFMGCMLAALFLNPRPDLIPQFQVNSVSVDNFFVSVSTPQLTGDWNISMSTKNPNQNLQIVYNNLGVLVLYKKEFISGAVIKPFEQLELEETFVKASISMLSASISNKIAKGIEEELIGRRVVEFEVMIETRVDIEGGMKPIWFQMTALCENLKVEFPWNATVGVMLQIPLPCKVQNRLL